MDQPAAGPRRPPAAAHRRPVRPGALRRHRRPVAQEGDAGDLRPRQPRPAAARVQPGRLRPARLGRPGLRADRARLGEGARPHRVPRGGVAPARRGLPVRAGRLRRRRRVRQAAAHHRGARRGARHRRQPRVLPLHPAEVLRRRDRPAQGARARRRRRRLAGAASWWRSRSATTCESARELNATCQPGVPAGVGLPDRPLPRQGDGAEHPGDALRQQPLRADLERQLRRPRADHHGRGHRHRRPGRLLRRHRRGPRRDPEPPAPADGAGRDGGADLVRRGRACGSRSRRCSPSVVLPRRLDLNTARGQYAAGWAGGEKVNGYLDEEDIPKSSTTETFAAIRLDVETRRWAGVPFYLRTGKRLGRRVTEVAVVFKRAPHLPFTETATEDLDPQRHGLPDPARRGRHDAVRLQGARHAPWRSATSTWTSPTAARSPSRARRPTSG